VILAGVASHWVRGVTFAKTTAGTTSCKQHNGRVRVVSDPNCYLFYLNDCHIYLYHDFTRIFMRRYIDQSRSNAKETEKTRDQPKTTPPCTPPCLRHQTVKFSMGCNLRAQAFPNKPIRAHGFLSAHRHYSCKG